MVQSSELPVNNHSQLLLWFRNPIESQVMAYYSTQGPKNKCCRCCCCFKQDESEKKRSVEIAAPIGYVWTILTNVHDYSSWADFSLSGNIAKDAVFTLKDNATVIQSEDGRMQKVKSVQGRVSKLVEKKAIEFSFDRGEGKWSIGFALYIEETGPSSTIVQNLVRYFGPYDDIVEKVLSKRLGYLKSFCEHSHTRSNTVHDNRIAEPSGVTVAVAVPGVAAPTELPQSPLYAVPKKDSIADELLKLADLKKQDLLSDDEYAAAKRRLLYDANGYTRLYG